MTSNDLRALKCQHCGGSLELPRDPRLLHVDCPYCGQDNLLPPHLIAARERLFAAEQEATADLRRSTERASAARTTARTALLAVLIAVGLPLAGLGSCGFVYYQKAAQAQAALQDAETARTDPEQNGQSALLLELERLRKEEGCQRILLQPEVHDTTAALVSLNMLAFNHCVQVIGRTGSKAPLTMTYAGEAALSVPLPLAKPSVDYRVCATVNAEHSFSLTSAAGRPFSVAAVECPRRPSEGASRAQDGNPVQSGKERVLQLEKALLRAGCRQLPSAPATVYTGIQQFSLTSPDNAACLNMLVASHFSDVPLRARLKDPNGHFMPVPAPGKELRVAYCAPFPGVYEVSIEPSSADPYAIVSVECDRNGPEGLARLSTP